MKSLKKVGKKKQKLTILMPSLNEEKAIGSTIDKIPISKIKKMGYDIEILIVDGGSHDRTKEIAESKGARIITSPKGYGLQYKNGFREARGKVIVTADSDASYPMEDIPRLLQIFEKEKIDFITTNRFASMEKGSMRFLNGIGNTILTFFTNFLFSLNIKDSQSGMWVIKREALKTLILTSDGMPLSQELKIEAFKKLKAIEVDASSYKKRVGKVKLKILRDGFDNLFSLFKKRISMRI